jgi:archaellum component FlaG (FlaF/FlaG flagellin family)
MRNTNSNTGIIAVLLTVMLLSAAAAIPAVAAPALSIAISPDPPVQGETSTVTVLLDGTPVQGADVHFVLNDGSPVHGQTDASGTVNYKPLLTGTLSITVLYEGTSADEERPIYERTYGVLLNVSTRSQTISPTETATYTLEVTNTGNGTDTIDLTQDGIGTLCQSSVTLAAEASEPVTLTVSSTTPRPYQTIVTATSQGDPSKTASVSVITTVEEEEAGGIRRVGGGRAPRDSDGDGYSDIQEMLAGSNPDDPCDPDPNCAACLAIRPLAAVPAAPPTVPTTTAPPTVPTPAATPAPTPPPLPEEPGFESLFAVVGIIAVAAVLAIAYLVLRKKKG